MKPKTVDDYIALQPVELREMLEQIRSAIKSVAPKAEEVISYMVPCYKLHGMLIAFGAHKKGCSLYAMRPDKIKQLAKEFKDIKYAGSTIHFDAGKKIPIALIKKATKLRLQENIEKAKAKEEKANAAKEKKKVKTPAKKKSK